MPAKYFPSRSQGQSTLPSLTDIFTAPRGSDPMGPTGKITPQPNTNPYAPLFGQFAEALQDPRLGMLPMMGGFRAVGGAQRFKDSLLPMMEKQIARRIEMGALGEGEPYVQPNTLRHLQSVNSQALEREPLPHQEFSVMRQPQGDRSLISALDDLRRSMGWDRKQMGDWLSKQEQNPGLSRDPRSWGNPDTY